MGSYAVVRTDRMHGSENSADLVSVKYQVSGTDTAIENGNVVVLGGLVTGAREVFIGAAPAVTSTRDELVLIATPELLYDESSRKTFADFRNEAGAIARGYRLRSGDVFSVTMEALAGRATLAAVTVGDIVEVKADTKLNVVAEATSGSTVIGKVIAKDGKYVVILVA